MFLRHSATGVLAAAIMALAVTVQAVTIDMVPVGDAGNEADDTSYGAVDYDYQIAKFEITVGQYVEFLNAVAKSDPFGLWNPNMYSRSFYDNDFGTRVSQTGTSGSYSYSAPSDYLNLPMNAVEWQDAARFCNWLTNGQPTTGVEDISTTEDGSYFMNGLMSRDDPPELLAVTRKETAVYVVPNLNEWYKAAYYDTAKPGGAGYWDYPTRSDAIPGNDLSDVSGNNANWQPEGLYGAWTVGPPYYRSTPGTFANSEGPWGTFDQAGNVREWCEEQSSNPDRPMDRYWAGGSYSEDPSTDMLAGEFQTNQIDFEGVQCGMRVAKLGSSAVDVTWTGGTDTAWTPGTGNWKATSGGAAATYGDGVNVTFDDSATGTTTANISAAVAPTSVTFNNSTKNFTITGTAGIGGAATVLKQGTGTVTMSSANSYTGLTTLENGKLVLQAGAKTPVLSNAGVDVKFGKLVLDYTDSGTSPTAVDTAMKASYAGGAWTGGKFQSSTATTANTLGWKADTVNKLITVEYTLYGDANVDGSVNLSDLGFLGDNYGLTTGATWAMGDFNYDGRVNLSDLGFLGDQYGGHVADFVTAGPANPAPEPGTLAPFLSALPWVCSSSPGGDGSSQPTRRS